MKALEAVAAACVVPLRRADDDPGLAESVEGFGRLADVLAQAAVTVPTAHEPFRVVLMGRTQAGKSTLFGYLTAGDHSPLGNGGQRTTRTVVVAPLDGYPDVVIVDTPGVGAKDGDTDRAIALAEARRADLVIWVAANNATQTETGAALGQLATWGVPMLVALNCRRHIGDDEARRQFLDDPEFTFGNEDGYLARMAEYLDPHAQRPAGVFILHAAAALSGARATPADDELVAGSRIGALAAAIVDQANQTHRQRRAVAIVDSARRLLVDVQSWAAAESTKLDALGTTWRDMTEDLDRRADRIVADADRQFRTDLKKVLRSFDDWADRHYRLGEKPLQARWDADAGHLVSRAEKVVSDARRRLCRKLEQVQQDVAVGWSKRLAIQSRAKSKVPTGNLPPPWIEGALRALGPTVGLALLAVPGPGWLIAGLAVVGGAAGGFLSDRLVKLLRLRRNQLQRQRKTLHRWVRDRLEEINGEILNGWTESLDLVREALAEHHADLTREQERIDGFAAQARLVAERARAEVERGDVLLTRLLLSVDGRGRLAELVGHVIRHPGFATAVSVSDPAGFDEFTLWPPDNLPEAIRAVPDYPDTTPVERAAYALDLGRRGGVVIPGSDRLRAAVPDETSPTFRAAESAWVSRVARTQVLVNPTGSQEAPPS